MIRLREVELPAGAARWLDVWQSEINSASTQYKERVDRAKLLWGRKRRTKTFETVVDCLTSMCSGARRCCYCEDSLADEVEHIKPKDLFPGDVFRWPNFLYACGPCNGPKNNPFAVFSQQTGEYTDITRRRGDPVEPPVRGTPVLINPRTEDPAAFLQLDLRDTFYVLPLGSPGTTAYNLHSATQRGRSGQLSSRQPGGHR